MSDTRILVRPYVIGPTDTSFVVPAGGGVGTLLVDGVATGGGSSAGSFTITLTTTKTNDIIVLMISGNGIAVTGIASSNTTGWASRAIETNNFEEWYGIAASPLTSEVITVTMGSPSFCSGAAMAVNGADISSLPSSAFDITPVTGLSGTPSGITTIKAATIIFGGMRGNGDGAPPATWTDAAGAGRSTIFGCLDYKIFASIQTGIGIADTMTGINGWIADAIKASGQ